MSELLFYHKDLKVLHRCKITKKKPIDWYIDLGNHMIVEGLKKDIGLPQQKRVYKLFIKQIQNTKKYKIQKGDAALYIPSNLALVKLAVYDYDDATSPIWISPPRRRCRCR